MSIIYHEKSKVFHLTNKYISYILYVMENDQLENLYYGKRIHDREDFSYLHETTWRSQMTLAMPDPSNLSLHYVRQEYPFFGSGDYRSPAGEILQADGSRVSDFKFRRYEIFAGKSALSGLPATYAESEDEAETLEITLTDEVSGTDLTLSYTLFRDYPVITRHSRFTQNGEKPVTLLKALSASVEFLDMDYEMLQLSGAGEGSAIPTRAGWNAGSRQFRALPERPAERSRIRLSPSCGPAQRRRTGRSTVFRWCTAGTISSRSRCRPST